MKIIRRLSELVQTELPDFRWIAGCELSIICHPVPTAVNETLALFAVVLRSARRE